MILQNARCNNKDSHIIVYWVVWFIKFYCAKLKANLSDSICLYPKPTCRSFTITRYQLLFLIIQNTGCNLYFSNTCPKQNAKTFKGKNVAINFFSLHVSKCFCPEIFDRYVPSIFVSPLHNSTPKPNIKVCAHAYGVECIQNTEHRPILPNFMKLLRQ